jgi:hypothetical protein
VPDTVVRSVKVGQPLMLPSTRSPHVHFMRVSAVCHQLPTLLLVISRSKSRYRITITC